MDYYKPDTITNNLSIPKLPTEEDLLDELLDSVLSQAINYNNIFDINIFNH